MRGATSLRAQSVCSDVELRQPLAILDWAPAEDAGSEQTVVVSLARDGLERGAYSVIATLQPEENSFTWDAAQPGINHFWWVLTLQAGGWVPSAMSEFIGATCEADISQ
jgi:hypothetical protein